MERRVVATLLTCMDGLDASPGVVVLAATNRPNSLDPALRRPGRLDREIEIPIPSASDRLSILQKCLSPIPNAISAEDLATIAGKAHGYVGADLTALCKEAALLALHRSMDIAQVMIGDVHKAMAKIRPSALREITLDIPRVLWSEIGGQGMIKQQLKEAVEWPLQHPEAFVRMGIRPPKGILLYGPPGCSKTLTAKALATEGGMNFIAIKGPELFSKWVGESEKAIQSIFSKARAAAPSVVFFDEIDAVASSRQGSSSGVGDRVLSQLLNELDGIEPLKKVIIVAATNRPDLIDSALMRPGRIDRILYVGPPDCTAREEILRIHTRKMPLAEDVNIKELANLTDRFSGAELAAYCREAALCAIQEDYNTKSVARRHFNSALGMITPQIDDQMLDFFDHYRKTHRGA
ncbi:ATPase AFG2 protein [Thraustotheca clavata]|uniref:ATPase AFG2 protein n=1 Tax=Thraustotheca clavata TaxID=74557 RepID=A0A1V9ZWH3_9STRA|nr:ATPase AFG2 protein [Thraustotheca clavata]